LKGISRKEETSRRQINGTPPGKGPVQKRQAYLIDLRKKGGAPNIEKRRS